MVPAPLIAIFLPARSFGLRTLEFGEAMIMQVFGTLDAQSATIFSWATPWAWAAKMGT